MLDILSQIFSQYSLESIILLVVGLAVSIKFLGEIFEWFYTKIRKYFNFKNNQDRQHSEIVNSVSLTQTTLDSVLEKLNELRLEVDDLKQQGEATNERLQEEARSYIIDKHHYFCYEIHAIDDLNLQSLERRFMYYKNAGGNSFVNGLMEDIRKLPRVTIQNVSATFNKEDN